MVESLYYKAAHYNLKWLFSGSRSGRLGGRGFHIPPSIDWATNANALYRSSTLVLIRHSIASNHYLLTDCPFPVCEPELATFDFGATAGGAGGAFMFEPF